MQEHALRTLLLIKAVEETDRAGTLIPPADRAAATRQVVRDTEAGMAADRESSLRSPLSEESQKLAERRAELLRRQLVARHPFVDAVLALAAGRGAAAWLLLALAFVAGVALSALDGSRRINILAFPLLGLVLWNFAVYALVLLEALRSRRVEPRRGAVARLFIQSALGRVKRMIARSTAFNAVLAQALGRFFADWSQVAAAVLTARAIRWLHLAAAAIGAGLVAGLYLRGLALDYQAGWESTFLSARQVHLIASVVYGPAALLTGVAIPDVDAFAMLRWEAGRGGANAAAWIHLLAATAGLFVIVPRVLLALGTTAVLRNRLRDLQPPPTLAPYVRAVFGGAPGVVGRGIAVVVPYAYQPSAGALGVLRGLLQEALGAGLDIDVRQGVRYGEEEQLLETLTGRGATPAEVIALLFSLAATPEDENHGVVVTTVRDWLERERRATQLLALVDEGPYSTRLGAAVEASRVAERRSLWRRFVAAHGLEACFVDLGRAPAAIAAVAEAADRVRATLWQAPVSA